MSCPVESHDYLNNKLMRFIILYKAYESRYLSVLCGLQQHSVFDHRLVEDLVAILVLA